MTPYIDPYLDEKISTAGQSELVEAIFVVKEGADLSPTAEDCGLAQRVVECAVERTGDLPRAVRYFPRANAVVILASSKLIQELIKDERLAVASATEVDPMVFSNGLKSA